MYIRQEGFRVVSFVPEDEVRVPMAGTVRAADPPAHGRRVLLLPRDKRVDALLRDCLADRLGRSDSREQTLLRTFLKAANGVCQGGNPAGVCLTIRRGQSPGSYEVYPQVPGVGRVAWLPMLVTRKTARLDVIFREAAPRGVVLAEDRVPAREGEERRVAIPPRVDTVLVPGKRP